MSIYTGKKIGFYLEGNIKEISTMGGQFITDLVVECDGVCLSISLKEARPLNWKDKIERWIFLWMEKRHYSKIRKTQR